MKHFQQSKTQSYPGCEESASFQSHSHTSSRNRSSSSSIDSKISTSSSSSGSIPSQISSTSSVDSALIGLYTSCVFKDFPHKSLSASPMKSSVLSVCLTDYLLIAGTTSHGIQVLSTDLVSQLDQSDQLSSSSGSVKAILSPAKNCFFTSHQDGGINIWSLEKSIKKIGALPTKLDKLSKFLLPHNYIQVRRHRKTLWIQHADAVSCLGQNRDFIFSGSWDKTIKIWRRSSLKCVDSIKAHQDAINAVVAHEQFVYTAAADGKIKAWEISQTTSIKSRMRSKPKLTMVAVLENHSSSVNALALDGQNGYLYSASSDKSISVWEREETALHMAAVDRLKGHCMAVLSLASCNVDDNFFLCSGSADKTIRVWSRERYRAVHCCLSVIKGHQGPVKSLAISTAEGGGGIGGGALVVSGGLDCQVRTWWVSLDGSPGSDPNKK